MKHAKRKIKIKSILLMLTLSLIAVIAMSAAAFADRTVSWDEANLDSNYEEFVIEEEDSEATLMIHTHNMTKTEAKEAKCEDPGNTAYWTCDQGSDPCGKSFADEEGTLVVDLTKDSDDGGVIIPALGHDWGEWTQTIPATEIAEGWEERSCNRDDCNAEDGRLIPKFHRHVLKKVEATTATCTTPGNIEYYICTQGEYQCNRTFREPADDADLEEIDIEKPISEGGALIPAKGHEWKFTEWTWRGNETNGYTEATIHYSCKGCNETRYRVIYPTRTVIAPTCTEPGKTEYRALIPWERAADLTKRSDRKYANFKDALGHSWDAGIETKAATATETGVKTYTCTVCGETRTEVIPISISKAYVSGLKEKAWNGKAQQQNPVVILSGSILSSETDYVVTYKNNKNVGLATLIITGKGNYTGTIRKTFKINPKGTSLRKLKKGKKSITVRWKKQPARMSTSRITGYQIQLAENKKFNKNKKIVNVKGYNKVSKKISKLKAGKTYYVRIRTYTTVNGKKYYSNWSKFLSVKTK